MRKGSREGLRGPLAPHAPGFGAALARAGYSRSASKKQSQLLARLSAWLEDEGLEPAELETAEVERFFRARREQGYANLLTRSSMAPLVEHLLLENVIAVPPPAVASGPVEEVLERFRTYLLQERGLVEGTARFYIHVARLLASERVDIDGVDLVGLQARDITSFTARICATRGLSSSRQVVSALRTFLRFLVLEGVTDLALDQAVLSVAGWSPSLPRAISSADVVRLLASCDRRSTIGRRGLRHVGPAVPPRIARRRGRGPEARRHRLALGPDHGARQRPAPGSAPHARRRGRGDRRVPETSSWQRGPAGVPARSCSVPRPQRHRRHSRVLARACRRAGMAYVSPHRLRHTTATEMLRAGVPLAEIGQVLGHAGAVTTAIYAKVDYDRLRALARPWPAVAA